MQFNTNFSLLYSQLCSNIIPLTKQYFPYPRNFLLAIARVNNDAGNYHTNSHWSRRHDTGIDVDDDDDNDDDDDDDDDDDEEEGIG